MECGRDAALCYDWNNVAHTASNSSKTICFKYFKCTADPSLGTQSQLYFEVTGVVLTFLFPL